MIKLLFLAFMTTTAQAQWTSADYQAGKCVSVNAGGVDLSSVTTALAGKQASGSYLTSSSAISPANVDLSTVTTALATKQSATTAVPASNVDLSTVTTALSGKQSTTAAVPIANVSLSTVTAWLQLLLTSGTVTAQLANAITISSAIPTGNVNLSTVTTAINLMFPLTGGTVSGATTLSTTTLNWAIDFKSITIAQAKLIVPAIGRTGFFCTNCVPPKILVGTGTSAGNWSDAVGAGFK